MHLVLLFSLIAGTLASVEVCMDDYPVCEQWANVGECYKNSNYVLRRCKKSCGVCGNVRCRDYGRQCSRYVKRGYCTKYKNAMTMLCRMSCRFCTAPPTALPTVPVPTTSSPPVTIPGTCGVKPNVRIVGGTEAPKNAWPWQAMLTNAWGRQFCGGTLIHPEWVLSASHCLVKKTPSTVKIRMGAHYKKGSVGTEQIHYVAKIILHPSYHKPRLYAHDIALIKLSKPAMLNKAVGIACLPSDEVAGFEPGKKCWITGWGHLQEGGINRTNVLMQASVPIKSDADCKKSYPGKIHDSMVCAGLDQGGIDACQGDSGGPMVCEHSGKFYIEGATSWGYGCARPHLFGVYAKVRYLREWILQTMTKN